MSPLFDTLNRWRYPLLVVLALVLLLSGINSYPLRGSTEPREAGVAAEMLQSGDYVVPRLNGTKFLEKPPLSYWLQATALRVFGYQPWAVRMPSILAGVLCVCLLLFAVEKLFAVERLCVSRELGWIAALVLLTMGSFWSNARIAGQDILLTFGVALTLWAFYFAHSDAAAGRASRMRWWLLYAAGVFVATFTKGVVGAVIPGFVIVVFLCLDAAVFGRGWRLGDWLRPLLFALAGIVPLALWLYALYRRDGVGDVVTLLWANSFGRFAGHYTHGEHAEPFYYYLAKLPETFAPWNLLLFVALWQLRREVLRERTVAFFYCWLLAPYLLLSLSTGKRPPYLLMIYPAAAVLIALLVRHWRQRRSAGPVWLWWLYAVLFGGGAVYVVVQAWRVPLHAVAAVFAVPALALLAVMVRAVLARSWRRGAAAALVLLALVYAGYGGALLRHDKDAESLRAVFVYLEGLEHGGHMVILYRPIERVAGAARFYLRHEVVVVDDPGRLRAALQRNPEAVALIGAGEVEALRGTRTLTEFLDQKRKYAVVAGSQSP